MQNNHQTVPPPPGLDAIHRIVSDLTSKYLDEDARGNALERRLNESRIRRDSLKITIDSLKKEYGVTDEVGTAVDPNQPTTGQKVNATHTADSTPNQGNNGKKDTDEKSGSSWQKPEDKSWLDLVRGAIRHYDRFVTMADLFAYLGMDAKAQDKYYNTITSTLATYRSSEQIIGIKAFKRTPNGKAMVRYLSGLPDFVESHDSTQIKPEYEEKLVETLKTIDLYRTELEAKL